MPLMIYSQYTKPEGTIKFDELVISAKKRGIKYLALTDHGNFSGITEFYSKCLDTGIKPVIGMDIFAELENGKFIRVQIYIKNYDGYKNIIKIVCRMRQEGKTCICKLKDLDNLKNCYISISCYRIDLLSEQVEIEPDFKYIESQIASISTDENAVFYHILFDDDPENDSTTKRLLSFHQETNIQLLGSNPVYYIEEGNHKIKEMASRVSGEKCCEKQFRNQYLGSTETFIERFPASALENRDRIYKSCHFIIDDAPIKFPEFRLKGNVDYSYFETLKEKTYALLADREEENSEIIYQELAYIRKHGISDIMLFLIEVKNEFFEKFDQNLFFSGFVNDLHLAYIFNLTLSSPVFSSKDYHRSVLANKKLHPQITVVVSPENRSGLFNYMAERFPEDSICFLSEYTKWHFISITNALEKEYGIPKNLTELLNKYYNKNYRSAGQFTDIMKNQEVEEELKKFPEHRELFELSIMFDDAFKNYTTNTNQLVIGSDKVTNILPVIYKHTELNIPSSFYNMNTAKHFGVWNINVESNNYPEIRKHFGLGPAREPKLTQVSNELINRIKKDDLSMIPYFTYNHQREKFLEISSNPVTNLILYLESGRSNLNFLLNRPVPETSGRKFKKELEITRGFIVFKEQFYYVCDKLFSAKEVSTLKSRLLESAGLIQYNSILNQISEKKGYAEKCDYLRSAFQATVFYSSLSEISAKVIIALRMLELKIKNPKEFKEFIFLREANSDGEWRKYIKEMQEEGFVFQKISIANITEKAYSKDMNIFLPVFSVKGISEKVANHIYNFINSNRIDGFQDFLEKCDKDIIKHNTLEILIKIGFFDIFNANRRELENLNDDYFKSLKKDDQSQPELFEASSIAIGTDSASDYTIDVKRNFEEEYTGIIFSSSINHECELCGYIKLKEGQKIKIDRNIYNEYTFILYVSLENSDDELLSELTGSLSDEGNCEIEIYFSDPKEILTMKKKLDLNDNSFYRLKTLFRNIPFYIEIKEKRDE
jgi:DNA polymerase-3 subunit alpha